MRRRYVVMTEASTFFSAAFGVKPSVSFSYYRWRWLAKICASWRSGYINGVSFRSRLLGRATLK